MTAGASPTRRYVGWRCRLYPSPAQDAALLRCRNGLRELANALLANSQLRYGETGRRLSLAELRAFAREWKREPEHRAFPASATYRVASDLDRAFRTWFSKPGRRRRRGFPQIKGIGREPGIYFSNQGICFEGNRVWLPKFGSVRWKGGSLPRGRLAGPPGRKTLGLLSGRAWLDAGNRWMLSCLFECAPLTPVEPSTEKAAVRQNGKEIRVTVDGEAVQVIRESRVLRKARRRLARLERRLERCAFGSEGRKRALARMRNQARKVRNHQEDLQHKTTTGVVHDAREIEVEGASSELLRQLEYKAEWHGRQLKVRRGPPKPGTGKPQRAPRPGSRSLKRESRTRRPKAL
ncbi:MAG: transposase [Gammaproteobacteria bacterium]|nr:transposase [Gammaproteobacteria bacterium]